MLEAQLIPGPEEGQDISGKTVEMWLRVVV